MLNLKTIIISLSVLSLASCEKPVSSVDGPKEDPKLVIACFISPQDTIIKVHISKSIPVFGVKQNQPQPAVTNATVTISDGVNSRQLAYQGSFPFSDPENFYYVSTSGFPISAGKTYSLTVVTTDGLMASAECTVPGQGNNSLAFTFDSFKYVSKGDSVLEFFLKMDWTDVAGQKDYYRTYAEVMMLQGPDFQGNYDTLYYYIYLGNNNELIDDADRDGEHIELKGSTVLNNYTSSSYFPFAKKVFVSLIHADKNYFLYHESVFKGGNGGNPFSEPVLTFTNVKNGLGVFAAFNTELKVLDL